MDNKNITKSLRLILITALIAVLTVSLVPVQVVRADEPTSTSDLVVSLVSIPKHVKGCEVFEVFYKVTNLGPDPAYHVYYWLSLTDEYDPVGIQRAPDALNVGDTVIFSAVVKVTGYVAKPSTAGVGVIVGWDSSDPYRGYDPNPANNEVFTTMKLISQPVMNCWE
jgi:hypothetical protein